MGRHRVAIVGGGFTGTMLAAQLARRGIASLLIDGSGRVGRGVAYSTREPAHLLNVRAEGMSAWPDTPGHFAARFAEDGGGPRGFAERRFYADYLGEILDEARGSGLVETISGTATAADHDGGRWRLTLDDGRSLTAEAMVLATGNEPPGRLAVFEQAGERFIGNPWGQDARAALDALAASGGEVLFVGTGLTMIDLVLSLDSAGFVGRMTALSRRGLVPRAHADFTPAPVEREELPNGDLIALTRWLRRRSASVGWRAAIDSLRPHSQTLWQSLDPVRQARFLRHARAWWDVHRHRIAPEVAAVIKRLVADGQFDIIAGRVVDAAIQGDRVAVTYDRRGGGRATRHFDTIFNCTGPLGAIERTRDPLLRSLFDRGAARGDALGIGLEVDDRSRVAGSDRLWAAGPPTRARFWEIVAVPDIRLQVAAIADDIAKELGQ